MKKLIIALVLTLFTFDAFGALTVSNLQRNKNNDQWVITGTIAFDSSYPTGGESLSASLLGLSYIEDFEIKGVESGYSFEPVVASGGATVAIKAYFGGGDSHTHAFTGTAITPETITITDDDTASGKGVVLRVGTFDGATGFLTATVPSSTDGTGLLAVAGSALFVKHDGTPTVSSKYQVYFDEDGANADERLLATLPGGQDLFVPLANGTVIRINHDSSASSNGVAVYFDHDAVTTSARLLFVSPTNTNGTGSTDDSVVAFKGVSAGSNASSVASVATEFTNSGDLSALTAVNFQAVGR